MADSEHLDPALVAGVVNGSFPPSGTTVAEWVAKSRQESSHRPRVINRGNGFRHVGLWQIQETHAGKAGSPWNRDTFVLWLQVPDNNFRMAKHLYENEGGWRPWNASGGKPTPTAADREAAEKGGSGWTDPLEEALELEPLQTIADAVQKTYEWVTQRKNLGRLALGGIGLAVIIAGAAALAKPTVEGLIPK